MNRREFIRITGMGSAFVFASSAFPFLVSSCSKSDMMNMDGVPVNVIEGEFDNVLVIPSIINNQGTLVAQNTNANIFKGKLSGVLGYQSGGMLGATILVNFGDNLNINVQNNLSESTNVHWHGILAPADMDGHPSNVIQSGATFNYNFIISQRAGMYWYHPHPDENTAKQAYKGLAGLLIVNDNEEKALNLPSGDFEIPLVIQDKRFFPDYAIDYSPQMNEIMTGYFGQYITVNGIYSPYKNVNKRKYRIRILNGSNARIYNLALSNGASFIVIGSDGGLLSSPQTVSSLLLGPGERIDLIIDFSSYSVGSEIFLMNHLFSGGTSQGTQEFKIMKFVVAKDDVDTFTVPGTLASISKISESSSTKTRTFDISNSSMGMMHHGGTEMHANHTINNKTYDSSRIDETVQAGATEIWVFNNSNGDEPHPMHIHGVQFQILDRTGGRNSLIASELGWKDTLMVMPGEKVRVIITFSQNKGKYLVHCHNLEHEDDGMMLQFEVI